MRILHVMAGAKFGGAETACIDMCIAMKEAGHDVALATRKNPRNQRLVDAGVDVYTMPFGGGLDFYTPLKLRATIKAFQPDMVQTWLARAAQKIPKWKGSAEDKPYRVLSRLGGYYKIKYFANTDYFATITPDIKRHLETLGVGSDKIRHINNFAETETATAPINRAEYNTPQDAPLLLGLGRLHEAKAFDTLIKAVTKIPAAHLWIAGEGPERANLEQLIDQLGVQDRIKLLGWRNDRAALLQAANICMFTSRYEPFGTVFVQAWAQQCPVIVSDADGPRQFVKHEEDGLVTKRDNEPEIIAAIERLIAEPKFAQKLVKNGLKRYQNEFTKDKCVENYIAYYNDILK